MCNVTKREVWFLCGLRPFPRTQGRSQPNIRSEPNISFRSSLHFLLSCIIYFGLIFLQVSECIRIVYI